jgi:uncharacterized membrane protein YbhN (UPF0104 family)
MKSKKIIEFRWIILFLLITVPIVYYICCKTDLSQYFKDNNEKGELFKVCLTVIAGVVGILIWHSSYKRVKLMQKQVDKTTKQIQIMQKSNI